MRPMSSVCHYARSVSDAGLEPHRLFIQGTPLTLIQGPLQDAIANVPESKTRDGLRMAYRNVTRLSRLVDSLMDFSKLAANRLEGMF